MKSINITLTFTDDDGTVRSESRDITPAGPINEQREHIVSHILFAELAVTVGYQAPAKHNATARGWVSQKRRFNLAKYFDAQNSDAAWFELSRLVLRVEADLILAQAFKALEPSFTELNDLYYIHSRKMMLLDRSVHYLIKVQNLVDRLLHESLGGDLVDTSGPDWEKYQLRREKVLKGLDKKRASGDVSQTDFDAIKEALAIPEKTPKGQVALTYRNRLTHHIRPSVDDSRFYSFIESRVGQAIVDSQGNIRGRFQPLFEQPPVEYSFQDLHAAFYEYLDAIVEMLQRLRQIAALQP
jgi:hypothetical protein